MITFKKGDLFVSGAATIVNAVNCVGVMGGGIAAEFRKRYPDMYQDYRKVCDNRDLYPGDLHIWFENDFPTIVNFPTKDEVVKDSKIEYIELGLPNLAELIEEYKIPSIAIPALGSGLGGLDWKDVKPLIMAALQDLDCEVMLYEPW